MAKNPQKPQNIVRLERGIISVKYKEGLEKIVPVLFEHNPNIDILSSGGTATRIREIMGREDAARDISEYTGVHKSPDDLVMTINHKVAAGMLMDPSIPEHAEYMAMAEIGALPFQFAIVGLYPHAETIAKPGTTVEDARDDIDIGGDLLIRMSAKAYKRMMTLTDREQYPEAIEQLNRGKGTTTLLYRWRTAIRALRATGMYDTDIAAYMGAQKEADMLEHYGVDAFPDK
ncbi:MAG: hypothetical protein V3V26_00775 [Candidatus Aenigmarchaeota archaeon]